MRVIVLNQAGWINSDRYNYNFSEKEELLKFYDHASRMNLSLNQIHFLISFDEETRVIKSIVRKFNNGDKNMATEQIKKVYFRPHIQERLIQVGKPMPKSIVKRLSALWAL